MPAPPGSGTLALCLRPTAPGLTSRAVLDKFAAIQMLDVHFPMMEGRTLHPQPLHPAGKRPKYPPRKLNLQLSEKPPPPIMSTKELLS